MATGRLGGGVRIDQPKGRLEDPLHDASNDNARGQKKAYSPSEDDVHWVEQMRAAVELVDDFIDANLQADWQDALAMFNSEHPSSSKYHEPYMAGRSALFRPKTRSMVRGHEAAMAHAFFTNPDVVTIASSDGTRDDLVANGKVLHEVTNLRLKRTIPWFKILTGAFQSGRVFGAAAARVEWQYQRRVIIDYRPAIDPATQQPMIDPEKGLPLYEEFEREIIDKDQPWVELVPLENFLVHPGASWLDPIGTSPFVIERVPIFVGECLRMMEQEDPKTGNPAWRKIEESELYGGEESQTAQAIRVARTANRQDRFGEELTSEHDIIWVHRNIFRQEDGENWQWYSVGDYRLLSDPVPLEEATQIRHRPYVFGQGMIESNQLYPQSLIRMTRDLQGMLNDISNLGIDNVKMNLAPLTKVIAESDIDTDVLLTRAPYDILELEKMTDVEFDRPPDMGPSRFAEADRIAVEFDEMGGTFSQSSVQSNRKLNETVGGMEIMGAAAGSVTEFDMRVFANEFVQPVLYLLVHIIQKFETDQVILATAAKQAQIRGPITDEMMNTDVTVTVNVGVGSTNPDKRLGNLAKGFEVLGKIGGPAAQKATDFMAIADEVMGLMGYDGADRFFLDAEDPAVQLLQETIKQLEAQLAEDKAKQEAQIQVAQINAASRVEQEKIRGQMKLIEIKYQARLEAMKAQVEMAKGQQDMVHSEREHKLKIAGKVADIKAAEQMGRVKVDNAREMSSLQQQTARDKAALDQDTARQQGQVKIAGDMASTKAKVASQLAIAKAKPVPAASGGGKKAKAAPEPQMPDIDTDGILAEIDDIFRSVMQPLPGAEEAAAGQPEGAGGSLPAEPAPGGAAPMASKMGAGGGLPGEMPAGQQASPPDQMMQVLLKLIERQNATDERMARAIEALARASAAPKAVTLPDGRELVARPKVNGAA